MNRRSSEPTTQATRTPRIFISYRRADSGPTARRLAETLAAALGEERVFLDTDAIRMGQNWPAVINSTLESSTVLIPVIGPQWLYVHNEFGKRRIDLKDDWVRREIATALERAIPIIPVIVNGAASLTDAGLPGQLKKLTAVQSYEVRDEFWKTDLPPLINHLVSLGFVRLDADSAISDAILPPPVDRSKPLNEAELNDALSRLREWRIVKRPALEHGKGQRTELYRAYRFKSFEDAMHFMLVAARYASQTGHHPDWQNLWINLQVWLTTWDIGHQPTFKDVRLAEYLDRLYIEYLPE